MSSTSYEKQVVAMKHWLLGMSEADPRWLVAFRAMEFGMRMHSGLRKDGVTPEFEHQLFIARLLRTLRRSIPDAWVAIAAAFLHDVREDRGVPLSELRERFGNEVAEVVEILSKKTPEGKKDFPTYVRNICAHAIACLVKGVDRLHNISTMVGVFTREKQAAYLAETREYYEPMLKGARDDFPEYEAAMENVLLSLRGQCAAIEAIHAAG